MCYNKYMYIKKCRCGEKQEKVLATDDSLKDFCLNCFGTIKPKKDKKIYPPKEPKPKKERKIVPWEETGTSRTREMVRVRDNHTCQMCGKKWVVGKRRFDVHHLNGLCGKKSKKYDKISEINGLITLCHKCHYTHPEHSSRHKGLNL